MSSGASVSPSRSSTSVVVAPTAGRPALEREGSAAGPSPAPADGGRRAGPLPARRRRQVGMGLGLGMATLYLSLIVLIPLAAVVVRSMEDGLSGFWAQVTTPEASSALKLTVVASLLVALINLVMGTLIAWVLVRDD